MLLEVETAVKFLSDFLRSKSNSAGRQTIQREAVEAFATTLSSTLHDRFQGHWHPHNPLRGSGYRCIINQSINGKIDPILLRVGRKSGIPEFLLRRFLPQEMALWIDPCDVSYRIGEQGSVCSLISPEKENPIEFEPRRRASNSITISSPRSATPEKQQPHHALFQVMQLSMTIVLKVYLTCS
jgi:protein Tob/BTG